MNDINGNENSNNIGSDSEHVIDLASMENPKPKANFIGGTIGAIVAGALGMLGWFLIVKLTGYEVGYAAWGVGVLVGTGTRLCAKMPSKTLGVLAGVISIVAIIGGTYAAMHVATTEELEKQMTIAYEADIKTATRLTKSDSFEETRNILYDILRQEGVKVRKKDITQEQVEAFEAEMRPYSEKLLAGDPSKEQYFEEGMAEFRAIPFKDLVVETLSLWTLLWAFLGIGSAFKIAAGSEANS